MANDESELSDIDTKEIEPIYKGKLDFEIIKKKPILKPIAEMNNSYINFELLINRALYEYLQDKKAIDEMVKLNPKYSETILLSKIQSILGYVKQIIHIQNIEKENMKNTINEMVKIAEQNYGLLEEESEEEPKIIKKEDDIKKEEIDKQEKSEDKKKEDKPKEFFSELVEKNIPIPDENKEGFIPIPKK